MLSLLRQTRSIWPCKKIHLNQVSFEYGDSNLPLSPLAGGSGQTVSILAAVAKAIEHLHQELLRLVKNDSPLAGATLIANAVFNATGKRIRDLPITLDKLL